MTPLGLASHVILIDGSGFLYRAHHVFKNLSRSDGLPVGAVYGFCVMMVNMAKKDFHKPPASHSLMILDRPGRTFRHDLYDLYKANRKERPPELKEQMPYFDEATEAFNMKVVGQAGVESDDLIATYTRLALEASADVTIVTQDKDMLQLIRPGVRIYEPKEKRWLDADDAKRKFGVVSTLIPDVQGLCGDYTDNIPGVPGIGEVTAAALINLYGDLEGVLAAAPTIKQPTRRQRLVDYADQARLSKQLAVLNDRVPVELTLEACGYREPNVPELERFCTKMEFRSLLPQLRAVFGLRGI